MVVNVIDSIMGSGKSTWARNYMNKHPEKKWLFVTPYLTEIEKTENECHALVLDEPKVGHKGAHNKSEDLTNLLKKGRNIVTTHALFLRIKRDKELFDTIRDNHYNLIIDETLDVVQHEKIKSDDFKALLAYGACIIAKKDEFATVEWLKDDYNGSHSNLKEYTETGKIYVYHNDVLIWMYNPDVFRAFDSVYLLTYLFEGSRMRSYFNFMGFEYSLYYVMNDDQLHEGTHKDGETKSKLKKLIDLYDGNLNDIGNGKNAYYYFSKNWYDNPKNKEKRDKLFKNAYNYLHNKCKATSGVNGNALYTTFVDVHTKSPLMSYKKSFLQCGQKSTNDYINKTNLAYLVNVFEDPEVTNFFSESEISYNESLYALNMMIQWIWRSAIRNEKPIHIFIPSQRMREFLNNWLDDLLHY